MGQKANPNGMRLGIVREWKSRYFAKDNKQWTEWVVQDRMIRNYFEKYFKKWSLSVVEIDRTEKEVRITINTSKPGMVLGQEGSNIKKIQLDIIKLLRDKKSKRTQQIKVILDVKEIKKPDLDATIIANEIASQLENRVPFRIAQKRVIRRVMRNGAKGIKTQVSGRLNGVDMARTEGYLEGQVPLQTLRYDIDFAKTKAKTTYGILGVKVWISRGEILKNRKDKELRDPKKERNLNPEFRKRRFENSNPKEDFKAVDKGDK